MRTRISKRRGFTLTELLIVLILLGTVALASTRLFYATMKLNRTTAATQDRAMRIDQALTTLRSDAWVATDIAADAGQATLGDVVWTAEKNTLKRTDKAGKSTEWDFGSAVALSADNGALVVTVAEGSVEMRVVSQAQQLARLSP